MRRLKTSQYIVTYKYPESLEFLHATGSVTYRSYVLNLIFIDTELNKDDLTKIYGVQSVTKTYQRLFSNKMKSDNFYY